MNVIFHIDDSEKWNAVLENVKNMLKYGAEDSTVFKIEVVANSKAASGLLKTIAADAGLFSVLEDLSENVSFAVCGNSLSKLNCDSRDLCPFVCVVPSGVVEIARKQCEGYAYIKP